MSLLIVTALWAFSSCSSDGASEAVQLSDASSLVAAETLVQWVSLSDLVVEVEIEEEGILDPLPQDLEPGRADTVRTKYVATVIDVLWSRPDVTAPTVGDKVEFFGAGRVVRAGGAKDGVPFHPYLETGRAYVLPLGSFSTDGLGPLTFEAILPVDGHGLFIDWSIEVFDGGPQSLAVVPPSGDRDIRSVDDLREALRDSPIPDDVKSATTVESRWEALTSVSGSSEEIDQPGD